MNATLRFDVAPVVSSQANQPANPNSPIYWSKYTDKKGLHWSVCNLPSRFAVLTPFPVTPWKGEAWHGELTFDSLPEEILEDDGEVGKSYKVFKLLSLEEKYWTDEDAVKETFFSDAYGTAPRSDRAGGQRSEQAVGARMVEDSCTINPYLPGEMWDALSPNKSASIRRLVEAVPDFMQMTPEQMRDLREDVQDFFAPSQAGHGRPAPPLQIENGAFASLYVGESHRTKILEWSEGGGMSLGLKLMYMWLCRKLDKRPVTFFSSNFQGVPITERQLA